MAINNTQRSLPGSSKDRGGLDDHVCTVALIKKCFQQPLYPSTTVFLHVLTFIVLQLKTYKNLTVCDRIRIVIRIARDRRCQELLRLQADKRDQNKRHIESGKQNGKLTLFFFILCESPTKTTQKSCNALGISGSACKHFPNKINSFECSTSLKPNWPLTPFQKTSSNNGEQKCLSL